jgi:hypothetical protein
LFESFAGFLNGQSDYYTHTKPTGGNPDPKSKDGFDFWQNKSVAWDQIGTYSMDFYMQEATRVVEAHDTNGPPLFLYFAHQEQVGSIALSV